MEQILCTAGAVLTAAVFTFIAVGCMVWGVDKAREQDQAAEVDLQDAAVDNAEAARALE